MYHVWEPLFQTILETLNHKPALIFFLKKVHVFAMNSHFEISFSHELEYR